MKSWILLYLKVRNNWNNFILNSYTIPTIFHFPEFTLTFLKGNDSCNRVAASTIYWTFILTGKTIQHHALWWLILNMRQKQNQTQSFSILRLNKMIHRNQILENPYFSFLTVWACIKSIHQHIMRKLTISIYFPFPAILYYFMHDHGCMSRKT